MTTSYESPKASNEYEPLVLQPELSRAYSALLNGLAEQLEPFCKPDLMTLEAKNVTFGTASAGSLDVFRATHNGARRSDITFTGKEQEDSHDFKVSLIQGEHEPSGTWMNQLDETQCNSRQVLEMLVQEWPSDDVKFPLGKMRSILYDRDTPVTPEHIFGLLDLYTELHTDSGIRTNGMQWTSGKFEEFITGQSTGVQSSSLSVIETNGSRFISMDILIANPTADDEDGELTCRVRCDNDGNVIVTADYNDAETGTRIEVPVASQVAVFKQLVAVSENMLDAKMVKATDAAHVKQSSPR